MVDVERNRRRMALVGAGRDHILAYHLVGGAAGDEEVAMVEPVAEQPIVPP